MTINPIEQMGTSSKHFAASPIPEGESSPWPFPPINSSDPDEVSILDVDDEANST